MIVIESSIATKAKPAIIWNRWIDVSSWKEWNIDLDYAKLTNGFRVGSHGELSMNHGRIAPFVITRIQPDKGFELTSHAWGNTVIFKHVISLVGGMQRMTMSVEVEGWTSWIFGFWFRLALTKKLPASLTRLAFLVEEDQARAERDLHVAQFKK